jgi:two-component system, cell cycle response regulator
MDNRVLIVDDDPSAVRLLHKYLVDGGMDVMEAANGEEAMRIVLEGAQAIVVTDRNMPGMSGLELCRALRNHEGVRFAYIIMITAQCDTKSLVEALDAGADDFLAKPVNPYELLARLRAGQRIARLESDLARHAREIHLLNAQAAINHEKLVSSNQQLNRLVTVDDLTGLLNRRETMNRLRESWAAWERHRTPLACIMIDIDHFKAINDAHGHVAGDLVLTEIAGILSRSVRIGDIVGRVGGEEFLIVCPFTDTEGAFTCADHLRKAVADAQFNYMNRTLHVTISLGVAEPEATATSPDAMLLQVDRALYASKAAGRNRATRADGLALATG